jgi:hypothetical protein
MTDDEGTWYTIAVEVWAAADADPADADELLTMIGELGGTGAVVTSSSTGFGARFDVEVFGELEAAGVGHGLMLAALDKVGIPHEGVAHLEVMDERYANMQMERPIESILGVAEVAELLGVQKQRVPQLRVTRGFPAPLAELASGPVWKESTLRRFAATWERRPGRPRKVDVGSVVEKGTAGRITPRRGGSGVTDSATHRGAKIRD